MGITTVVWASIPHMDTGIGVVILDPDICLKVQLQSPSPSSDPFLAALLQIGCANKQLVSGVLES